MPCATVSCAMEWIFFVRYAVHSRLDNKLCCFQSFKEQLKDNYKRFYHKITTIDLPTLDNTFLFFPHISYNCYLIMYIIP